MKIVLYICSYWYALPCLCHKRSFLFQLRDDIPACMEPFLSHRINPSCNVINDDTCQSRVIAPAVDTCQCLMCNEGSYDGAQTSVRSEDSVGVANNVSDTKPPLYERCQNMCRTVGEYLEKEPIDYFQPYLLPEALYKRFWVMDLVHADSRNSCCFTKGYYVMMCFIAFAWNIAFVSESFLLYTCAIMCIEIVVTY